MFLTARVQRGPSEAARCASTRNTWLLGLICQTTHSAFFALIHPVKLGSARMGGSPATSACNPRGETWEVRDLYVCDASAFPTASGVNPMISIEAIAHMNARGIAATLA